MPDDPLASLSPAQRDSFETFTAFTARDASAPDEARKSVELLRDAGWDVQVSPMRACVLSVIELSMSDGETRVAMRTLGGEGSRAGRCRRLGGLFDGSERF